MQIRLQQRGGLIGETRNVTANVTLFAEESRRGGDETKRDDEEATETSFPFEAC